MTPAQSRHVVTMNWCLLLVGLACLGLGFSRMTLPEIVQVVLYTIVHGIAAVLVWQHGFWKGRGER